MKRAPNYSDKREFRYLNGGLYVNAYNVKP